MGSWKEDETNWRNGRIVRTKGGTEDQEEERDYWVELGKQEESDANRRKVGTTGERWDLW
jgi:hypothetical protein